MTTHLCALAAVTLAIPLSLAAQLNGTYTVDPAGGGNYTTISAAVNALNTLGVSGPVTIRIVPGNYPESFTVNHINGTSAARSVWFESSTLDNTAVTIGPGTDSTTIRLLDCDHVGFRFLRVNAPDKGFEGNSYPTNIEIHHCVVIGSGPPEQDNGIVFWQGRYLNLHHNNVDAVDAGIIVSGDGLRIEVNDNVVNARCSAIQVGSSSDVEVRRNTATVTAQCFSAAAEENAIRLLSCDRPIAVTANRTRVMFGGKSLHMSDCIGSNTDRIKVANNMFVNDPIPNIVVGATTCAFFDHCEWVDVYHNSALNQNAIYGTALELLNGQRIRVKGNNLKAQASAAMRIQGIAVNNDHNVLYSPTGRAAEQSAGISYTFAQWQALGHDPNSVFIDPLYTSPTDLHLQPFSPALNRVPLIYGVVQDIDGEPRPMPITMIADAGCDERQITPPVRMKSSTGNDILGSTELRVYPNPVNDVLHIEAPPEVVTPYRLYRSDGRMVMTGTMSGNGSLDMVTLGNGSYILQLDGAIPQRIIVQH
jgi:hypothetical protein